MILNSWQLFDSFISDKLSKFKVIGWSKVRFKKFEKNFFFVYYKITAFFDQSELGERDFIHLFWLVPVKKKKKPGNPFPNSDQKKKKFKKIKKAKKFLIIFEWSFFCSISRTEQRFFAFTTRFYFFG